MLTKMLEKGKKKSSFFFYSSTRADKKKHFTCSFKRSSSWLLWLMSFCLVYRLNNSLSVHFNFFFLCVCVLCIWVFQREVLYGNWSRNITCYSTLVDTERERVASITHAVTQSESKKKHKKKRATNIDIRYPHMKYSPN